MRNPTSRLSLTLRSFCFLCCTVVTLNFAAAQSPIGTWTGLDKTNNQGQLREATLTLRPASPQQVSLFPSNSPLSFPMLEKQILVGTLDFKIPNVRGARGAQESREVVAAYYPQTQAITLFFAIGVRVNYLSGQLGVFDPDGGSLALFHTGMAARNSPPYLLVRGDSPPSDLKKLTALNASGQMRLPNNPISILQANQDRKAAQRAAQKAAQMQQKLLQKYMPQMQALRQEMLVATQAGDYQKVKDIQSQLQELALNMAAIQRGEIPEDADISKPKSGSGCPENIMAWTAEVAANGGSHQEYGGPTSVANLFRDAYFIPHFDKPFAEISKQQAAKIARSFQARCLLPGNSLYHSRIATSLSGAFNDTRGFGRFDAAAAARALDTLARWQETTTRKIAANADLKLAELYEQQRSVLAKVLWPKEQVDATERMAAVLYDKASETIFTQLDPILGRLKSSDDTALTDLTRLKKSSIVAKLPESFADDFDATFWSRVDPVLESYLQNRINAFSKAASPREILANGKQWHNAAQHNIPTFEQRPAYRSFVKDFSIQRENAYKQTRDQFAQELAAIQTRAEAERFAYPFFIPLDSASSPTWRGIKNLQAKRIREIDWETHLARVGDGPFGPNYPGAVYLNAIYRGDIRLINQEDQAYQKELIDYASPLIKNPTMDALSVFLTGGMLGDISLADIFIAEIKDTHAYDSLVAYLVVNYHKRYANCGGRPTAVIPVTTITRTIREWSDGSSDSWESGRETNYHTVLQDHSQAWRSYEGKYSSPERLRFAGMLSKLFSPHAKELNYQNTLADTVEGLGRAMRDFPCDHDVIKTLEANLLDLFNGRQPARSTQIRTSWKAN